MKSNYLHYKKEKEEKKEGILVLSRKSAKGKYHTPLKIRHKCEGFNQTKPHNQQRTTCRAIFTFPH